MHHSVANPCAAVRIQYRNIRKDSVTMKATGIVRRIDDLGRVVIPKEIRRTLRIREGDPLLKTLTVNERYLWAMKALYDRLGIQ